MPAMLAGSLPQSQLDRGKSTSHPQAPAPHSCPDRVAIRFARNGPARSPVLDRFRRVREPVAAQGAAEVAEVAEVEPLCKALRTDIGGWSALEHGGHVRSAFFPEVEGRCRQSGAGDDGSSDLAASAEDPGDERLAN
jgi:hypothetical protein